MIKTIVLDPGHWGREPGAIAVDKVEERVFNIAMATALRDALDAYACQVVLTREQNWPPVPGMTIEQDLFDRAKVGNDLRADLFVSIHHDAGPPAARGGSLWIWTEKRDPRNPSNLVWLPAEGNHSAPKSYAIAQQVFPALRETLARLGVPWRGTVQCADFAVLRHSNGPAILLEAFFGSNHEDVAAARRPEFIPTLARAFADAIAGALQLPRKQPPMSVPVRIQGGRKLQGVIRDGQTFVVIAGQEMLLRPVAEAFGLQVQWVPPERGGPAVHVLNPWAQGITPV